MTLRQKLSGRYETYFDNIYLNFYVFEQDSILFVRQENDAPDELFIVNIDSLTFKLIDDNRIFGPIFDITCLVTS